MINMVVILYGTEIANYIHLYAIFQKKHQMKAVQN